MKVGILGTGDVARALGLGFKGRGHDVMIGTRDPGADARQTVTDILTGFGRETIDIGGTEGARLLEPLCVLWVVHGLRVNGWNHAFKLLRR